MNRYDVLKNPIYSALVGCILTIVYLYLDSVIRKEKKETNEYLITSGYVGVLCYFLIFLTQPKIISKIVNTTPFIGVNPGLPDF
tara:strand:- start:335 stop:586 length:252 start_codon:yes stop_codon:yes gene_type:complete